MFRAKGDRPADSNARAHTHMRAHTHAQAHERTHARTHTTRTHARTHAHARHARTHAHDAHGHAHGRTGQVTLMFGVKMNRLAEWFADWRVMRREKEKGARGSEKDRERK